jgi:hypothetical protein
MYTYDVESHVQVINYINRESALALVVLLLTDFVKKKLFALTKLKMFLSRSQKSSSSYASATPYVFMTQETTFPFTKVCL